MKTDMKTGMKTVQLAVVGAHLRGQPLNHQLTNLNARFVNSCKTAPLYRLYALPGTIPPKPGLVRVSSGGVAIEIEVWELDIEQFGMFAAAVPPPLAIGSIVLETGESVKSFLCENYATQDARDISHYGGWVAFLNSLTP
jgi:allophanate hydrolase